MRHTADLMTPWPLCIHADLSAGRAAALLRHHGFRHFPVIDAAGRLVGVLTDDRARAAELGERPAGEAAVPVQVVVRPDDPLADTLLQLGRSWQDVAVIVDDNHRPVGVLTEHDVVRAATALLADRMPSIARERTVHAVQQRQSAHEALHLMDTHGIRHVVVVDGERLVGVLSWRDLVVSGVIEGAELACAELLSGRPVHTVEPWAPMAVVAREMALHRIGCLPVVEGARPVGIFTRTDVVEALRSWLESRPKRTHADTLDAGEPADGTPSGSTARG